MALGGRVSLNVAAVSGRLALGPATQSRNVLSGFALGALVDVWHERRKAGSQGEDDPDTAFRSHETRLQRAELVAPTYSLSALVLTRWRRPFRRARQG